MSSQPDALIVAVSPAGDVSAAAPAHVAEAFALARGDAAKAGQLRVLHPRSAAEPLVAAVSLGTQHAAPSVGADALPAADVFLANERAERVRRAAAAAARALRDLPAKDAPKEALAKRTIAVDAMGDAHSAAVGAGLALWTVNHFRTKGGDVNAAMDAPKELQGGRHISLVPLEQQEVKKGELGFESGLVYAEAQNWARELMETPANLLTPTLFCERVQDKLGALSNVEIEVHDEAWAKEKGMGCFLSVTAGTDEPAKMLELRYNGGAPGAPTLAFVGKGVCFDSGGISLKPGLGMKLMVADMGGAAACVSTTWAAAQLALPLNIVCVTPLVENMPSGKATKPGDIVRAMNGLSVEVDNTDAEGRLILADALTYVSRKYKPHTLIDVATLTGAILHALGHEYSGAFVQDETLWQEIKRAGETEGDQFWRMPLCEKFRPYITNSISDLVNVGRPAGSASAALFLQDFVEGLEDRSKLADGSDAGKATVRYAHLDIAGTMERKHPVAYQNSLMTGRPTRSLIEFARRFAQQ